jgi:hypothetical protein
MPLPETAVADEEFTMRLKKIAAGAVATAALGFSVLGAGSGVALAKPNDPAPGPPGPSPYWVPGDPPGHNPFGPPGQVKNGNPYVPGLTGVPPGHWGDPGYAGLPPTWRPVNWFDLGIFEPQPVVYNPDALAWGIWWLDRFIPFVA